MQYSNSKNELAILELITMGVAFICSIVFASFAGYEFAAYAANYENSSSLDMLIFFALMAFAMMFAMLGLWVRSKEYAEYKYDHLFPK